MKVSFLSILLLVIANDSLAFAPSVHLPGIGALERNTQSALFLELPTFGKKAPPAAPAAPVKATKKIAGGGFFGVKKNEVLPTKARKAVAKALPTPKLPTISLPSAPALPNLGGGVLGLAGKGMSLASPIFYLEARFQAAVTGFIGEIIGSPFRTNPDTVRADIARELKKNKAVIYTYDWSPFSTAALDLLQGYDVEVISMGPEWFLPGFFKGPENSERRVALEEITGSTSLPKFFVNGVSYGGFSTGGSSGGGISGIDLASLGLRKVAKKR